MPRLLKCLPSARSEDVEEGAERRESSEGVRLRELSRFLRGSALLELRNRRTDELRLLEVRTGSLLACCWSRVMLDSFLSRRPSLVAEGSLRTEEEGAFESSLAMMFFCSFLCCDLRDEFDSVVWVDSLDCDRFDLRESIDSLRSRLGRRLPPLPRLLSIAGSLLTLAGTLRPRSLPLSLCPPLLPPSPSELRRFDRLRVFDLLRDLM